MGKKEKLVARLKSMPKDFEFSEAKTLLEMYGYIMRNAGKTSGSRVSFTRGTKTFYMHKPHPRKELLKYQVNAVIYELEKEGLI